MIRLIRSMSTIEDIVASTSLKGMAEATVMLMMRVREAAPAMRYLQCEVSRKEIMDIDETFYVLNKETFERAGFIEEKQEGRQCAK